MTPLDTHTSALEWPAETFASHALARWAWRTHEFLVALLLVELGGSTSLRAVAVYGAADNAARLILTPAAGAFVDAAPRLRGAASMLLLQNASILASGLAAAVAFSSPAASGSSDSSSSTGTATTTANLLLTVIVAGGAMSGVGSAGAALGVEREWPAAVVAAAAAGAADGSSSSSFLSRVNSRMRAIDLGCQLLAPAFAGVLMTAAGGRAAALASACFCALAWAPQVLLLRSAVRKSAALSRPKAGAGGEGRTNAGAEGAPGADAAAPEGTTNSSSGSKSSNSSSLAAWARQGPLAAPALALALLYCTVLSLGMMMTAWLKTVGMTEAAIAGARGAGALSGVGAALLFPRVSAALAAGRGGGGRRDGVALAGLAGMVLQLGALAVGVLPTVAVAVGGAQAQASRAPLPTMPPPPPPPAPPPRPPLALLLAGLVASRAGLWTFDLAVTQLQQQGVPPSDQAKVGGAQSALQAGMELLSFFAAALLWPRPSQFWRLMLLSLGAVLLAAALYAWWWARFASSPVLSQAGVEIAGGGAGAAADAAAGRKGAAERGEGDEEALLSPPPPADQAEGRSG